MSSRRRVPDEESQTFFVSSAENDIDNAVSLTLSAAIKCPCLDSLAASPTGLSLAILLYRLAILEAVEVCESPCHF